MIKRTTEGEREMELGEGDFCVKLAVTEHIKTVKSFHELMFQENEGKSFHNLICGLRYMRMIK